MLERRVLINERIRILEFYDEVADIQAQLVRGNADPTKHIELARQLEQKRAEELSAEDASSMRAQTESRTEAELKIELQARKAKSVSYVVIGR